MFLFRAAYSWLELRVSLLGRKCRKCNRIGHESCQDKFFGTRMWFCIAARPTLIGHAAVFYQPYLQSCTELHTCTMRGRCSSLLNPGAVITMDRKIHAIGAFRLAVQRAGSFLFCVSACPTRGRCCLLSTAIGCEARKWKAAGTKQAIPLIDRLQGDAVHVC